MVRTEAEACGGPGALTEARGLQRKSQNEGLNSFRLPPCRLVDVYTETIVDLVCNRTP